MELFKKIDESLFPIFNRTIKNNFFDMLLPRYTHLGGLVFVISFNLLLILLGQGKTRYIGVQIALALTISQTITYLLKSLIGRERPYNVLDNLHTFGFEMRDYSFPSGHSSASFTVATIISLNIRILGPLVIGLASLIAISRMYVGVHYPTDVIAGILIGIGSSLLVYNFLLEQVQLIIEFIF